MVIWCCVGHPHVRARTVSRLSGFCSTEAGRAPCFGMSVVSGVRRTVETVILGTQGFTVSDSCTSPLGRFPVLILRTILIQALDILGIKQGSVTFTQNFLHPSILFHRDTLLKLGLRFSKKYKQGQPRVIKLGRINTPTCVYKRLCTCLQH